MWRFHLRGFVSDCISLAMFLTIACIGLTCMMIVLVLVLNGLQAAGLMESTHDKLVPTIQAIQTLVGTASQR